MYKLVCIDVDGTLLNSKHKLTTAVKESIRAAYDKGVHIVIATGRMYTSAAHYSDLIGLKSGIIASNGAVITQDDEIICKRPFPFETTKQILEICKATSEAPVFYTPDVMYTSSMRIFLLFSFLIWRKLFPVKTKLRVVFLASNKKCLEFVTKHKDDVIRFEIINSSSKKIENTKLLLAKLGSLEIANSTPYNIEITAPNVSKGTAVEYLANRYGIKKEEVLCIGDSENDITMLRFAGLGVAMGNATPFVKEAAGFVTDTNDNDGVAKVIDQFILGISKDSISTPL